MAEAALGEGSGVKLHKLSVKELKAVRLRNISTLTTQLIHAYIALWHVEDEWTRQFTTNYAELLNVTPPNTSDTIFAAPFLYTNPRYFLRLPYETIIVCRVCPSVVILTVPYCTHTVAPEVE